MSTLLRRTLATTLLLLTTACGKAELGEECDEKGSTDACVEGLVCDTKGAATGETTCLQICEEDSDCNTVTETCTGVSGSNLKACHTRT